MILRALAAEYQNLLSSGVRRDKADIARRFAISRAWVTEAMKKGSAKGTCRNLRRDATET
jgi:hypothetical protein